MTNSQKTHRHVLRLPYAKTAVATVVTVKIAISMTA